MSQRYEIREQIGKGGLGAVYKAFDTQFARVWDGKKATPDEQDPPIATPRGLMPATDVAPQ